VGGGGDVALLLLDEVVACPDGAGVLASAAESETNTWLVVMLQPCDVLALLGISLVADSSACKASYLA
jgi:hypothetical protein